MTLRDPKTFGAALRRVLDTDEAYRTFLADGGTWSAGGCWLLARALVRWSGGQLRYVFVVDGSGAVQHVLARTGDGIFIDADGAAKPATLVRRWRQREMIPGARTADLDYEHFESTEGAICPGSAAEVRRLATYLEERLGPAEDWFVR